jgi:sec-independent protein translocase protein TatA
MHLALRTDASWVAVTKGIPPMGLRDLFEGSHAVILILVVVALFGWKRLPDAARGLGRSMRIFKSEMDEMNSGGKAKSSAARNHAAQDETVHQAAQQAGDPKEFEKQD